jgi:hypothetical protein
MTKVNRRDKKLDFDENSSFSVLDIRVYYFHLPYLKLYEDFEWGPLHIRFNMHLKTTFLSRSRILFSEANSHSASQEFLSLLWKPNVHTRVHSYAQTQVGGAPIIGCRNFYSFETLNSGKVKVKLFLYLIKHHAMKTYCGSGRIAPGIL